MSIFENVKVWETIKVCLGRAGNQDRKLQQLVDAAFEGFAAMIRNEYIEYSESAERFMTAIAGSGEFKQLAADIVCEFSVPREYANGMATLMAHFAMLGYLVRKAELDVEKLNSLFSSSPTTIEAG